MSEIQLHAITLENVIKLQLITITILITPTLHLIWVYIVYKHFFKSNICSEMIRKNMVYA